MILVVGFLICFFLFLVLYQIFIKYYHYKEGIDETTTLIPSSESTTTNITPLDKQVSDLKNKYTELNDEVQGLKKQMADLVFNVNGGSDQPKTDYTGL